MAQALGPPGTAQLPHASGRLEELPPPTANKDSSERVTSSESQAWHRTWSTLEADTRASKTSPQARHV